LFGFGSDLCISDNCNLNTQSYTNFGYSYETPKDVKEGSKEGDKYLAGAQSFGVVEIEVY
jgi:hypothetical protein